ncbi:hypothetical protein [Roseateles oligotrophus]|uniref:Uncharacterized protein n=1 Tax=Roseateles oligotrophus TaxID=1769250 RepID=A0ABT2YHB2_9BURK|nr:hypothetical protein [Roseateles oligotrophus]MCV2369419.1 hypothetical protein [Roseateles oligotrophus]
MAYEDPTSSSFDNLVDEYPADLADVAELSIEDRLDVLTAAEPTAGVEGQIAQAIAPAPLPVIHRTSSGLYRSPTTAGIQLELRVDVDGVHPLRKVSGDFFTMAGATVNYYGSFIVDSPAITTTSNAIVIRGQGRFTWSAGAPVVQVTIQRRSIFQPAAPAVLQFFTSSGAPGASYLCQFGAHHFRSVFIETDRVSDVTTPVFSSYNTATLPSGGPGRTLSVVSAYAEAGIQLVPTAGTDVIDIREAGGDVRWSDAELHASMVRHFSLWRDVPQWAVWQVVCQHHELGDGLLGIMFDQAGRQRQGCAVFHAGLGGSTPDRLREQLYCYVHELGHCFNLLHSWQKSLGNPPGANRPNAKSYMNYPWRYPGGAAAFWAAFGFVFDDPELTHLRHAFRNNIILGGNPFATGSSLSNPELMAEPISDQSGLQFHINGVHPSFALGEPVVIHLKLSPTDLRGKTVIPHVHPNQGMCSVVIGRPNGSVVLYEPYIDHLMASKTKFLPAGKVIEDSAYIGFGKGGLYFDQPGIYTLRAVYHALDGSQVMSNVLSVRVRYPGSAENEEVANLLLGEEQGTLFFLKGSDSEFLRSGNEAFETMLEKHPGHRLTDYVRFARGVNAGRTFKTISKDKEHGVLVRQSNLADANALLMAATSGKSVLDDLSKQNCLESLASIHRNKGDEKSAKLALKMAQDIANMRAAK